MSLIHTHYIQHNGVSMCLDRPELDPTVLVPDHSTLYGLFFILLLAFPHKGMAPSEDFLACHSCGGVGVTKGQYDSRSAICTARGLAQCVTQLC